MLLAENYWNILLVLGMPTMLGIFMLIDWD
jgi:hypothetical protein